MRHWKQRRRRRNRRKQRSLVVMYLFIRDGKHVRSSVCNGLGYLIRNSECRFEKMQGHRNCHHGGLPPVFPVHMNFAVRSSVQIIISSEFNNYYQPPSTIFSKVFGPTLGNLSIYAINANIQP